LLKARQLIPNGILSLCWGALVNRIIHNAILPLHHEASDPINTVSPQAPSKCKGIAVMQHS